MTDLKPVPGPRGASFVRYAALLARDPIAGFERCRAEFGDIFGFRIPKRVVLLAAPDAARHVLLDQRERYAKRDSFAELRALIGDGLLTADGSGWLEQRRALSPDFSAQSVAAFSEALGREADELVEDWKRQAARGETIDVSDEISSFTLGITARTLFGSGLGQDSAEFLGAFSTAVELLTKRTLAVENLPLSIPTPGNLRFNRAVRTLDRLLAEMLERSSSREEPSFRRRLSALAASAEPSWLRDQVLTFLLAGNDTTANLLCWTLQLLALHPEIAAQLRENDELLNCVLLESLRLYPPVPLIARDPLMDDRLCGYAVARGTPVYVMVWLLHRHPSLWHDAEQFAPQRFMDERLRRSPGYLPFGIGPRKCIGEHLALLQARIAIKKIIQAFEIAPSGDSRFVPELSLTLRPRGGLRLRLRPVVARGHDCAPRQR